MNQHATPARSLQRELLAATLLASAPALPALSAPLLAWLGVLSVWVLYRAGRPAPPMVLRLLLVAGSLGLMINDYGLVMGRQAGISLIIMMLLLKLLETGNRRDITVVIFGDLFLLATHFFSSQQWGVALWVFAVCIVLLALLIAASDRCGRQPPLRLLPLAARYLFYSLPFMLILFVLFPRIPGPLWGLPEDAFSAESALGESMAPGDIGQLVRSADIAMRVKFDGAMPPRQQWYWRGVVLAGFDGKRWSRSTLADTRPPRLFNTGVASASSQL